MAEAEQAVREQAERAKACARLRPHADPGLRDRIARAGRDRVARFSTDRTIDEMLVLYENDPPVSLPGSRWRPVPTPPASLGA